MDKISKVYVGLDDLDEGFAHRIPVQQIER